MDISLLHRGALFFTKEDEIIVCLLGEKEEFSFKTTKEIVRQFRETDKFLEFFKERIYMEPNK